MKKYILRFTDETEYHAGMKATDDVEKIACECGYKKFYVPIKVSEHRIRNNIKKAFTFSKLLKIEKNSTIIIQHPVHTTSTYITVLKKLKKIKNWKYIFVIHDLETLRRIFLNEIDKYELIDNTMYDIADAIIAHNEKMMDYLVDEAGVKREKLINLSLFDYLLPENIKADNDNITKNDGVIIAGNLDKTKCTYAYKLAELKSDTRFELYGVNWSLEGKHGDNWNYHGAFPPDELISHMRGAFGLVWDGQQLDTCTGATGKYVRYNNPHKVSLYIAAAIPVIIWKEAALADFITKNNIGIAISNLKDIDSEIAGISDEHYAQMLSNIKKLSDKVRNGGFTTEALKEAERVVDNR